MYCWNCGSELSDNAVVCVKCGCAVGQPQKTVNINGSCKDWLVTLILCLLCGCLGIHRFYAGKVGTGILMLLTAGGCGIWALIDLIKILMQKFEDKEGKVIMR
jgi:hypothetical protein